ncbi:MAG: ABC transporter substrate-binding protein, partial [Alphaproteobacteria bacterium]|nr:ABC transporter substrate-binding protein [Alphaproteobacteria bacterium]
MRKVLRALSGIVVAFMVLATQAHAQTARHGLSLHGTPRYPATFKHLDYVNPEAPKGGELHLSGLATFDTLNPFTLK